MSTLMPSTVISHHGIETGSLTNLARAVDEQALETQSPVSPRATDPHAHSRLLCGYWASELSSSHLSSESSDPHRVFSPDSRYKALTPLSLSLPGKGNSEHPGEFRSSAGLARDPQELIISGVGKNHF